jgi:hypothetical protein
VKRIFRKLSTKPVWWWERKRNYSIRSRYRQLPPLPVKGGRVRFVVLTAPETLSDALWSAWSWYRYLRHEDCKLEIAVDGVVSAASLQRPLSCFPVSRFIRRNRHAAMCTTENLRSKPFFMVTRRAES